jgi:polyisoprenoid-binding protein YceI/rhodanese-related sulfurtransferase
MSFQAIDCDRLKAWLDGGRPVTLLDVLPKEAFEEQHLPGARNACVYEVTFLQSVQEMVPDLGEAIVVYCSGPDCLASKDAAERLAAAGYTGVHRFPGGRAEWQAAGHLLEGERSGERWEPHTIRRLVDGVHEIDTEKSVLGWVGRNPANHHEGTMRFAGGRLEIREAALAGGEIEIDVRSIEVGDLDGEMADILKAHLEHEDFLAAERFPDCRFELTAVAPVEGASPGSPNAELRGRLTLRGVSQEVTARATVAPHGERGVAVQAQIAIDRTLWGMNYGSGKLYHRLGMHLVHDEIGVQVRLITRE